MLDNLEAESYEPEQHDDIMLKYKRAKEAWKPIFDKYLEDLRFANGDQWDEPIKRRREKQYLQVLTYDKIGPIINQVVNQTRKAAPAIKCSPSGEGANKNTAKVYDGIIKRIQDQSNFSEVVANGLRNILTGGIGAWKIIVDDDQIKPIRVKDPTKIIVDPTAEEVCFADANFIFEEKWISKTSYMKTFGVTKDEVVGLGKNANSDMFTQDSVLVLEYWCKDNGRIYKYIVNGEAIIGQYEWVGTIIPIVYLVGEEIYIEDSREYKGIVRSIKDAQKLLNLSKSRTADYLDRSSSPQWLATTKNISENVNKWNASNVNGDPVLTYEPDQGVSPQRIEAPAPPSGYQAIAAEADTDMRNAVGIGDPNAQMPDNVSSKTLELHLAQANIGTYGYIDSINTAIKYTGMILVDLIPAIYTEPEIMQIMGNDGNISTVQVNQPYDDNGQIVEHNLASGKYSVIISKGPTYESQRAEALDKLMDLIKITPQFMGIAGDIVFRNMDFDGSEEIADRLRAQIPPEILAASNATNQDNQAQIAQNSVNQLQQQLQQTNMQVQQMQQALQEAMMEKQAKITEINAKGEYDIKLKQMELNYQYKIEQLKASNKSEHIAQQGIVDIDKMGEKHEHDLKLDIHKTHGALFMKKLDHESNINRVEKE